MSSQSDAVRQEYDRLAGSYDRRWRAYVDATLRAVTDSIRFQGQEKVLDVACGTGELERLLLSRWPSLEIVGTDLSAEMLRQASEKDEAKRVFWVQAEASRLPFADHMFDCVICANSFHYFHSPRKVLQEIRRVLRSSGCFVLVDWCDDYLSCKLCGLWLRLTDRAFFRTYTLGACRSLLTQAGFEVVQCDHFRVQMIWGMMRFVCRPVAV